MAVQLQYKWGTTYALVTQREGTSAAMCKTCSAIVSVYGLLQAPLSNVMVRLFILLGFPAKFTVVLIIYHMYRHI